MSNKGNYVICHECMQQFELLDDYLIHFSRSKILECPKCDYPNSKIDLGL